MKLRLNQLDNHLKKNLATIYMLHGDEPLLIEQGVNAIRNAAKQKGFSEVQRLYANKNFKWSELAAEFCNLSLFAEKTFVKLSLPTGKPGKLGGKAIQNYIEQATDNDLLIIVCDKIESSSYKSAWYKAIEKAGVMVQVWPLQGAELEKWIKQTFATHNMQIDNDALQLLSHNITGNLLAAQQEIEKLFLIYGETTLCLNNIREATTDQAHFDIFSLVDAFLADRPADYLRIIHNLKAQGIASTLVLWAISRELRQLAQLAFSLDKGEHLSSVLQSIPTFRRTKIQQHLQQHTLHYYQGLLHHCASIDRSIKGLESLDCWLLLEKLILPESFLNSKTPKAKKF